MHETENKVKTLAGPGKGGAAEKQALELIWKSILMPAWE
jgi:hypothetical protein